MFVAYDATENRFISASEAKTSGGKSHVYICPNKDCAAKLILRAGEIKVEHFAHPADLTDVQRACIRESETHKDNDLSDWKKHWTKPFSADRLERMIKLDGQYKRADALFEESNTVVQLQHTILKPGEFTTRNDFFLKAGYRSVWVLDGEVLMKKDWLAKKKLWELSEKQQKLSKEKNQYHFNFSRWENIFGDYDPELDPNIVVYVAVPATKDGKRIDYLYRIIWLSPREKSSFSAQYTPTKVFFGDCAGTMPMPKEEADKVREKVLSDRKESAKRWQAEQERIHQEELRKKREAVERIKAEQERMRQEEERAKEEAERLAEENRQRTKQQAEHIIDTVMSILHEHGIMGVDDPMRAYKDIMAMAAKSLHLPVEVVKSACGHVKFLDIINNAESEFRGYLKDLPPAVQALPHNDLLQYIIHNKPDTLIVIENEIRKYRIIHK